MENLSSIKDRFYPLVPGSITLDPSDVFDRKIRQISRGLLSTLDYGSLADFFRYKKNQFAAGEFWGKIMRASAWIYSYTQDEDLMSRMKLAIDDILSIQAEDGEISTGPRSEQPNASGGADLWERKYVMLGMLGYYSLTEDERVKRALIRLLDYTISQVGEEEGKTPITSTGWAFYGIESSSILEPVVRIYNISHEQRHLDFAHYIVRAGGCRLENMFEAIIGGKSPRLIGDCGDPYKSIAKAYEMMSCFEGLNEYARVTGIPKYVSAAAKLYDRLIEEEITILGSGGADAPFNLGPGKGEQWNYTVREQGNPDIDLMMETCVTITWMKLCLQLLRSHGDSRYADSIELSAYNVLCGALRPDGMFFEYFPRFNGTRNPKVNFSYNVGGFDLSCCTANGPMGLGVIPQMCFMSCERGLAVNMYLGGRVRYGGLTLNITTDFPRTGHTVFEVEENNGFGGRVLLRIPPYAVGFTVGREYESDSEYPGYALIGGDFAPGSSFTVDFTLADRFAVTSGSINPTGNGRMVLLHGPAALVRDRRTGDDINAPVEYSESPRLTSLSERDGELFGELLNYSYDGCTWIDYQSGGATWDESSEFAAFAYRK